jgi:hypothetical protein
MGAMRSGQIRLGESRAQEKAYSDAIGYRGVAEVYTNTPGAFEECEDWIACLNELIQRYDNAADRKLLSIAYSESGVACMRASNRVEAEKRWMTSCEDLEKLSDPDELVYPFPWVHRGLIAAYFSGDPFAAESLVAPILKKREEKLGKNDTTTIE